jgi:group I intron endonuclease
MLPLITRGLEVKMLNIIYKVTNKENGEVYIGATKDSLEKRKRDHLQKANMETGHKFQEAIRTYGPEAFTWEQIDTANTSNELAEKESRYILNFNSNKNGLNSDRGGGIRKNIYQYDVDFGDLLYVYPDLKSAGNAVNVDKRNISKACLGELKTCAGFYWSYLLSENFQPEGDKRKKQVFQFTVDGSFIKTFKSVAEASRETEINKSSIAKVCRGEYNSAGNFYWQYDI